MSEVCPESEGRGVDPKSEVQNMKSEACAKYEVQESKSESKI